MALGIRQTVEKFFPHIFVVPKPQEVEEQLPAEEYEMSALEAHYYHALLGLEGTLYDFDPTIVFDYFSFFR